MRRNITTAASASGVHTSSWKQTMRTCFVSTHVPVIYFGMSPTPMETENYGATSAPLVIKDKVIVGTSGGDDGIRGFLAAYDAESGKEVWRFWTIPGRENLAPPVGPVKLQTRRGTTWMPGTFDPELNTIFWGTVIQRRLRWRSAPGRRPLHRLPACPRSGHRQAQMVFPVHAARPLASIAAMRPTNVCGGFQPNGHRSRDATLPLVRSAWSRRPEFG